MEFALLDDVLPEMQSLGPCELRSALLDNAPSRIGPLVEYAMVQPAHEDHLPALSSLPSSQTLQAFLRIRGMVSFSRMSINSSVNGEDVEFSWTPPARNNVDFPGWTAFRKRFQNAAEKSGFSKSTSQGLTGAFDEMVSNVLDHSERSASGFVGYRWSAREFEYLVADAGIGVLKSLKNHEDYADLNDAGTALKTALSEGNTRFGRESGRGFGFRQMFLSLSNLGGELRFRSDDHRLNIKETSPSLASARLSQTFKYQGFMASVLCKI